MDLKNITMDDLKEKLAAFDKKTLIKFGIGFGAIIMLSSNENYLDSFGNLIGSNNMAAVHLSKAVGGDIFLGFISAVAFATILATQKEEVPLIRDIAASLQIRSK